MTQFKRFSLFGCPMDPFTMDESVAIVDAAVADGKFLQHGAINVAKLVNMQDDENLRKAVSSSDLINIDGMGLVWGARLLAHEVPERVAGVDLFSRLIELSAERGYPVFLLGATEMVSEACARALAEKYPALNIAGYHHGYFWDYEAEVVSEIRKSGAKLLFVAITPPKKELFIERWRDELGVNFAMGVGGTFDIVAGETRRAPVLMQRSGLEWFYRIAQEPRRMWRRYLVTNCRFAWMMLKALLTSRQSV